LGFREEVFIPRDLLWKTANLKTMPLNVKLQSFIDFSNIHCVAAKNHVAVMIKREATPVTMSESTSCIDQGVTDFRFSFIGAERE
jgi:hypothetical protein